MVFGLFKKKEPIKCTVKGTGEEFNISRDTSLMHAAFAAGIKWPHSCKVGSCGSCRTTILEGKGAYPASPCVPESLLHPEEMKNGMVLACQWYPKTNLVVDVEIGKEGDKRGIIY
jgi:toluene methyl-monooxygenase electron transfer component